MSMSSFITALLTDLGFHPREPSPLQDPPVESPNDPTISPASRDKTTHLPEEQSDIVTTAGDAGSIPDHPFFTALPKDMDGRNADPAGNRRTPTDSIPSQIQAGGRTAAREFALNSGPGERHSQDEQTQSVAVPNGAGDHVLPTMRHGPSQPLEVNELGQMSLPADDGMGLLRNKIHEIQGQDLKNSEKARRIHDLMTESYNSSRPLPPHSPILASPTMNATTLATSPVMNASEPIRPHSPKSIHQPETLFTLSPEDLQPTYVPKPEPESPVGETGGVADEDPDTEELDEAILGCQHYMRNVKLQCFTCKKWYTCRFCHDMVEDHQLVRRDTENMLCMLCGHAQPAAQTCRNCEEQSAQYFCDICKLWDNDGKKSIYHCNDCGICRIGQGLGKDFFHCKTCCVCLPISIEDTHRCIENSTQCDCPICGEYMFTSPETVVVMQCGHSLHSKCLSEYSKSSFRCPICSKTITNMESTFRNLDRTIEGQPMPAEFKDTKGLVYCNDCGAKSVVKYHWLGLKCDLCESYNTAQLRLLQGDESAEEEGVGYDYTRIRSSSLSGAEEPVTSLASLHSNTNPVQQTHLDVPISAGPERRFVSYNMTHGRAISPVVGNYFGLPPERESEKPSSLPFFSSVGASNNGEYGALNFLSKKLRDRYGFLAGESAATDGISEAEDEDDEESSESSGSDDDEDEDDDEVEYLDIFGHR